jgi:hypothetical protein
MDWTDRKKYSARAEFDVLSLSIHAPSSKGLVTRVRRWGMGETAGDPRRICWAMTESCRKLNFELLDGSAFWKL